MKRFCILIVIGAAFLGGYHLGRLPGSPDLIGWSQRTIDRTAAVCRDVIDQLEDWNGEGDRPATPLGQADDQRTDPLAPAVRWSE